MLGWDWGWAVEEFETGRGPLRVYEMGTDWGLWYRTMALEGNLLLGNKRNDHNSI